MQNIFLTTTLPYANSIPHVGHALEFMQASAIKRYFVSRGSDVFLNVGADEHGLKMYEAGGSNPDSVMKYLDEMSINWIDFCFNFEIDFDRFYRTTDSTHAENVSKFWQRLVASGDIYMAPYEGNYCSGCESFKTETELVNGKCSDHPNTEITPVSEMNYFFALSKYTYALMNNSATTIFPRSKNNELQNIMAGAKDISISRSASKVPWGIPVPNDSTQTIYVWFEALLNYLFAQSEEEWNDANCVTIQLCGPDNIKFQGMLWQAMLSAGKCKNTDYLIVHGTVLDKDGLKMSKSLGNVLDPVKLLERHGLSSVRYYALKGLNTFENSGWDEGAQIKLYNSDLANNYGNLLARTLHLMNLYGMRAPMKPTGEVEVQIKKTIGAYELHMSSFEIRHALEEAMELLTYGNVIMNGERPWEEECQIRESVLSNIWHILNAATDMLSIALSARDINTVRNALSEVTKVIVFPRVKT
jgi:methionyl-tRNA synthetase